MATLHGRACAQSAGERKINETNKSRFKKTGRLLRGMCVFLYLMYSWKGHAGYFVPVPARFVGLCLSDFASSGYYGCYFFPLPDCRERKRKRMQADTRRPSHSQTSHASASLRKEKRRKSPAKSTQWQSFSLRPLKLHQKKVNLTVHTQTCIFVEPFLMTQPIIRNTTASKISLTSSKFLLNNLFLFFNSNHFNHFPSYITYLLSHNVVKQNLTSGTITEWGQAHKCAVWIISTSHVFPQTLLPSTHSPARAQAPLPAGMPLWTATMQRESLLIFSSL